MQVHNIFIRFVRTQISLLKQFLFRSFSIGIVSIQCCHEFSVQLFYCFVFYLVQFIIMKQLPLEIVLTFVVDVYSSFPHCTSLIVCLYMLSKKSCCKPVLDSMHVKEHKFAIIKVKLYKAPPIQSLQSCTVGRENFAVKMFSRSIPIAKMKKIIMRRRSMNKLARKITLPRVNVRSTTAASDPWFS